MTDFDALNIHQPIVWDDSPTVLDVTITKGESYYVGTGGPEFVEAVVHKLGLPPPLKSSLSPFRSQLFTDEPNASDWQDKWQIAWSLLLEYGSPLKVPTIAKEPLGIDATDETYNDQHKHWLLDAVPCRVLADFADDASAKAAAKAIGGTTRVGARPKQGRRLEIVAGPIPLDAPEPVLKRGNAAVALLRRAGGVTNLREKPASD